MLTEADDLTQSLKNLLIVFQTGRTRSDLASYTNTVSCFANNNNDNYDYYYLALSLSARVFQLTLAATRCQPSLLSQRVGVVWRC